MRTRINSTRVAAFTTLPHYCRHMFRIVTFTKRVLLTNRVKSGRNDDFYGRPPFSIEFYTKSLATRLPVSKVHFQQHDSWRLQLVKPGRRVLPPSHITALCSVSASTLDLSKTSHHDSSRVKSIRRIYCPSTLANCILYQSLATTLPISQVEY